MISVATEGFQAKAGGNVPEAEGFVIGGGNEESGVGREGEVGNPQFVAGEFVERGENVIVGVIVDFDLIGGDGVGSDGFIG